MSSIAGLPGRGQHDPAESQARELEALADEVLKETPPDAHAAPDAFSYELTIESSHDRRVIAFDYAHASQALRALLTCLRR